MKTTCTTETTAHQFAFCIHSRSKVNGACLEGILLECSSSPHLLLHKAQQAKQDRLSVGDQQQTSDDDDVPHSCFCRVIAIEVCASVNCGVRQCVRAAPTGCHQSCDPPGDHLRRVRCTFVNMAKFMSSCAKVMLAKKLVNTIAKCLHVY